jgi:hypothetical protein
MKTMMRKIHVALAAVGVLLAAPAFAVCNQSVVSQADLDLWNTHGCWRAFYLWHYRAYDTTSGNWSNRGFNDACNNRLEYPKHWNAAYLVNYGLLDDYWRSFHGTVDYRMTAEAASSLSKPRTYHTATDNTSIFGAYNWHPFGADEVQTSCLLYNTTQVNGNPGSRAGDFMHEGWHGWMLKYGYNNGSVGGHRPMQGNCTINGCDYFYFHGISAYAFGAMYQTNGTFSRFHSPNQVQVEFLCDVADLSQNWVPASVRIASRADSNQRATQRFINGPGYSCGAPRPW